MYIKKHERIPNGGGEELVTGSLGGAQDTGRSNDNEAVIGRRLDLDQKQTEADVAKLPNAAS